MLITTMEGKTFYVTKGKLKELQDEYAKLTDFEHRKTIGEEAPKMIESEDMNAEFVSYHEDMEALRNRIDSLKDIIEHHEIIKAPPKARQAAVDLGARVALDVDGKHNEFTIVGTLEADPEAGRISNESPVGKALLGLKVGDEVLVGNSEAKRYRIKDITYHQG